MLLRSVMAATLLVAVLPGQAWCADQEVEISYIRETASMETPRHLPAFVWERFFYSFDDQADDVFADRLHSLNMVKWSLNLNADDKTFQSRTASAAQNALVKTATYGARDAVVDVSLMVWLQDRQEWLADFLRDSIDSVEEESVSPLAGSYGRAERSWWKRVARSDSIRYGIRPFRTSPYAFTSFAVKDEGRTLFLSHVRYYYDHFSSHRFEFALSLPLLHGIALDMGTSYQFDRHDGKERVAIKLTKELASSGIIHFGFEFREHPVLMAGVTIPF
jgi:hypothetical protein